MSTLKAKAKPKVKAKAIRVASNTCFRILNGAHPKSFSWRLKLPHIYLVIWSYVQQSHTTHDNLTPNFLLPISSLLWSIKFLPFYDVSQ